MLIKPFVLGLSILYFATAANWAAAARQCDIDVLKSMANEIITNRNAVSFGAAEFVANAIYFKLYYGDGKNSILNILEKSKGNGNSKTDQKLTEFIDSMLFIQKLSNSTSELNLTRERVEEILSAANVPDFSINSLLYLSSLRALILRDTGKTSFQYLDENKFSSLDSFATEFFFDQPVDVLKNIAVNAEKNGNIQLAATVYALMPEGYFEAFAEREGLEYRDVKNFWAFFFGSRDMPAYFYNTEKVIDETGSHVPISFANMHDEVIPTILHRGWSDFEWDYLEEVENFRKGVNAKLINPFVDPESTWIFFHEALINELGHEDTEKLLSKIDYVADNRHYSGTAFDAFEMASAVSAAQTWLQNPTNPFPNAPYALSTKFNWREFKNVWLAIYENDVQVDGIPTNSQIKFATEAYIQFERYQEALDFAERTGGLRNRLIVARDILHRQNRFCDALGIAPLTSNLLYGAKLLYNFPTDGSIISPPKIENGTSETTQQEPSQGQCARGNRLGC